MAIFNQAASRKKYVKPCDFTKKIKEITATNDTQTWVANKDCWLELYAYQGSGKEAYIKINGEIIMGGSTATNKTLVPNVYVTRGSVIELYSSSTSASATMTAYGCL